MVQYKLGEMEQKFADLIWAHEPVSSGVLVSLCAEELNWKKSTTYTMLRRLCDRQIFKNQDGQVTSLMSKEEFHAGQGEEFIKETFGGSLPMFLAAFSRRHKLSEKEIGELKKLIDDYEET